MKTFRKFITISGYGIPICGSGENVSINTRMEKDYNVYIWAWSESSLCAQWVAKDPSFLHADSEDSDQTGRMPRLIWSLRWAHTHFVGFVMSRIIIFINLVILKLCKVIATFSSTLNIWSSPKWCFLARPGQANYYMSQFMRLWYLSYRRPAKAHVSLRVRAVSPEPSLFAHMKYGIRRRVRPNIKTSSLTGWLCMRVWRMGLRRTKSAIISWDGWYYSPKLPWNSSPSCAKYVEGHPGWSMPPLG